MVGDAAAGGFRRLLLNNERLVVLCTDEESAAVEVELQRWGLGNSVLGIRAAKGLEFPDVVLLDFFCHVSSESEQRAWKMLLKDGSAVAPSQEHYGQCFPQLEGQLKLLYTGITRCCHRLVFVERRLSPAGSEFTRLLEGRKAAERVTQASLRASEDGSDGLANVVLMTGDEWRVRGIDFALSVSAEDEGSGLEAEAMLRRAVQCFDRAGDFTLKDKAAAHRALVLVRARWLQLSDGMDGKEGSWSDSGSREGAGITAAGKVPVLPMDIVDAANAMLWAIRVRLLAEALSLAEVVSTRLEMTRIVETSTTTTSTTTTTTTNCSDQHSATVVRDAICSKLRKLIH